MRWTYTKGDIPLGELESLQFLSGSLLFCSANPAEQSSCNNIPKHQGLSPQLIHPAYLPPSSLC